MEKSFEIKFDFPLAHSDLIISLKATATLHHSDPYYVVDDFHFMGNNSKKTSYSVLPPQALKQVIRHSAKVWVHKDSERESLLGLAIGKAIDNELKKQKE